MVDIFSDIIWRPGMTDKTWIGWLTVAVYYGTALLALRPWLWSRQQDGMIQQRDRGFYLFVGLCLLLLGIVRQTGFLHWFTGLGRAVAWEQGWYAYRTFTQQRIIEEMTMGSVLLFIGLAWFNRRRLLRHGATLLGLVFLIGFLSVQAVSLHAVDTRLYYQRVLGLRLGEALEIGALLFIALTLVAPHFLQRVNLKKTTAHPHQPQHETAA